MTPIYICNTCGNFICEGALDFDFEVLDIIDGIPYSEPRTSCPFCGSFDIYDTDVY